LAEKYIKEGRMPQRAIALLDEAIMRYKIEQKEGKVNANSKFVLQEKMVTSLVAEKTGIPVSKISSSGQGESDYLEELLSCRIIGQEHAAKSVAQAMRTVKSGLKDKKGPDGIFYFLGPSGVGKTEFALTLAEILYGNNSKLMRIDMSELSHPGDITRLIGAAPSYVGYENGGVLTEWAKKNPSSVILLDEFEKAHPKCWDLFLQMFDAGRLTDGHGVSVDFTKTIIIMTSNIGSDCFIERTDKGNVGFANGSNHSLAMDLDGIHRNIRSRLTDEFRPEFINRIDEVIIFNPLSIDDLIEIARIMMRSMPVKIRVTDEILRFVAENGYNVTRAFKLPSLQRL
jgi:ATP-dependent Clp protease ATP-binding subunit ClpA